MGGAVQVSDENSEPALWVSGTKGELSSIRVVSIMHRTKSTNKMNPTSSGGGSRRGRWTPSMSFTNRGEKPSEDSPTEELSIAESVGGPNGANGLPGWENPLAPIESPLSMDILRSKHSPPPIRPESPMAREKRLYKMQQISPSREPARIPVLSPQSQRNKKSPQGSARPMQARVRQAPSPSLYPPAYGLDGGEIEDMIVNCNESVGSLGDITYDSYLEEDFRRGGAFKDMHHLGRSQAGGPPGVIGVSGGKRFIWKKGPNNRYVIGKQESIAMEFILSREASSSNAQNVTDG